MTRLLCLIFVLLLNVPTLAAQQSAQDSPLMQDASGDVVVYPLQGQPGAAVPGGRMGAHDLVSASVLEERDHFVFSLELASLGEGVPLVESSEITLSFSHGEQRYGVAFDIRYRVGDAGPNGWAALMAYDSQRKAYSYMHEVPVELDATQATVSATVERDHLIDERGGKPFAGSFLAGFVAESWGLLYGFDLSIASQEVPMPLQARDRMPDSGAGPDLPVRLGPAQTGHARLSSEVPARASNGEATTFVFEVMASNLDSEEDLFRLEAIGAPSAWTVTLPQTLLRLDGNEARTIPVLVTTPMRHQHGSRDAFMLEMHSTTDRGSAGRVELSVVYVETPQPAGHHDTLYLHARASDADIQPVFDAVLAGFQGDAWMNARADDAFSDGSPSAGRIESFYVPAGSESSMHAWEYPLSPQLQMGLDFDLDRVGLLSARVETTAPAPQAVLSGQLIYIGPPGSAEPDFRGEPGRSRTVIAEIEPSPAEDLEANGARDYQLAVVPNEEADLIPFQRDSGLVLWLTFTQGRPSATTGPETPSIAPGATLKLPLNEYHDPVDDVFATLADVALAPMGAQERLANPGRTVVFDVALRNGASVDHRFELGLSGTAQWAQILGPAEVRVASGGEALVRVAVSPPADARHGEAADLILEAVSTTDEGLRSLARLYVLVDTEREVADEAALAVAPDEGKDAAAPAPWVLVAMLVWVVGALRRRL